MAFTLRPLVSLVSAALLLVGCGHLPGTNAASRLARGVRAASVPSSFMWGVSTAGYQYEGYDQTSEWAKWDQAGKTVERNLKGADGLNRFDEDAGLSQGMGCNAFRTSLEWARIEPVEGQYDPAAIAHYHTMLRSLRAHGQTPVVTLMHWAYPAWLDAQGGWENPKTAERFAKYSAFVAREFGPEIGYYLTFNEPNVFLLAGWVAGNMPPGKHNPIAGLRALNTLVNAHERAYEAIHSNDPQAKVSFNMYAATYDVKVGLGLDQGTDELTSASEKLGSENAFGDALGGRGGGHMDYVAFDYYCRLHVKLPVFAMPRPDQWEVYPEGFHDALKRYYEKYKLPVLVAENGLATWDLAPRADHWTRATYSVAHVQQVQRALGEGIPVIGYIQWSITDNYEWGTYSPRFGLYSVECRNGNFTRVPTDGVAAFKALISAGGVTDAIARRYPFPGSIVLPVPQQAGGGSAVHAY